MGLSEAIQNCQRFVGKYGIRGVGGRDRVLIFCDAPPPTKVQNAILDAAGAHNVIFYDGPAEPNEARRYAPIIKLSETPEKQSASPPVIKRVAEELAIPQPEPEPAPAPVAEVKVEVGNINAKGKYGFTKLHFAAQKGDEAEVVRLLGLGANKAIRDNGGKTPMEIASLNGHDSIVELLSRP